MASGIDQRSLLQSALLLRPDNFTPLSRTPWAGVKLSQGIKRQVVAPRKILPIGESWELSADPLFPSRLASSGQSLPELLASFPEEPLPPIELLVKLLDTAEPLSLQVHPHDDDPHLLPHECGKPEAWLILAADKNAGIYLGFKQALPRQELRRHLEAVDPQALQALLQFVPVEAHDYFEIAPGTLHAIGKGVTMVETQRIRSGQSGKTYRLWDWQRRYDTNGKASAAGELRELHLTAGLPLVDPQLQVGEAYLQTLRRFPAYRRPTRGVELREYPPNSYSQVQRWQVEAGAKFSLDLGKNWGCVLVLKGELRLNSGYGKKTNVPQGWTALLPPAAGPFQGKNPGKIPGDYVVVRART